MYDYIAVSTRTLTPPTTGTDNRDRFVWVHADSFLSCVASPFQSFVTTKDSVSCSILPMILVLAEALELGGRIGGRL